MRPIFFLAALAVVGAVGCGSSDRAPNVELGGESAKGGKASRGGSAGADQGGGGGADPGGASSAEGGSGGAGGDSGGQSGTSTTTTVSPGAPVVTFLSPPSVLDPNAAGVITTGEVTVKCKAVAAAQPGSTVETATAEITMSQAGVKITGGQVATLMSEGARQTTFALNDISGVASGELSFDCTAEDNSSPALLGKADTLKLLVDRGPEIEILNPAPKTSIALSEGVDVNFNIGTFEIAPGDTQYGLDKVKVTINGKEVTVAETTPNTGKYSGRVALTDPVLFPPGDKPEGATTLQVVATNKRGVVTNQTTTFNVDSKPPTVEIKDPANNSIVGKTTTMNFTVKDDGSGVEETTVGVSLNNGTVFYYKPTDAARWQHIPGSNDYSFTFSSADFPTSETQLTVVVQATDKKTNSINPGATLTLFIDTEPPYVDLDPPTVRDRYYESLASDYTCSNAYDPLGEAINDLTIDNGADIVRALVWDMTNEPRDPNLIRYFSGVKPSSVTLYLQENMDEPVLVDTDGDKICDDVSTISSTSDTGRKPTVNLGAVTPTGFAPAHDWVADLATFQGSDDTRYSTAPALSPVCTWKFFAQDSWPYLCNKTSDMVHVISHAAGIARKTSAVYAVAPVTGDVLGCTGTYYEYHSKMKRDVSDGWLCLAAVAYDEAGNRGVSKPLRICYDDPNTSDVPSCAKTTLPQDLTFNPGWADYIRHSSEWTPIRLKSAETPPSCTKSCTVRNVPFNRYLGNQY